MCFFQFKWYLISIRITSQFLIMNVCEFSTKIGVHQKVAK